MHGLDGARSLEQRFRLVELLFTPVNIRRHGEQLDAVRVSRNRVLRFSGRLFEATGTKELRKAQKAHATTNFRTRHSSCEVYP